MRKQIITLFFFLKPVFVGANSLMDSAPIYSSLGDPSLSPISRSFANPIPPLSLTSFPVNIGKIKRQNSKNKNKHKQKLFKKK